MLLRTIWIANFADLIVVMTNGGPADSTQIVATLHLHPGLPALDFGYASGDRAACCSFLLLAYSLLIALLRRRC